MWIYHKEVLKSRTVVTKLNNPLSVGKEFATIQKQDFCNGNFVGFEHKWALLTNVVVLPDRGYGRSGGEDISEVLNQSEDDEYYKLQKDILH